MLKKILLVALQKSTVLLFPNGKTILQLFNTPMPVSEKENEIIQEIRIT
jgi:hypothetical protein